MTCRLSSLFSIGEDFDDEELLGTDWAARSSSSRPVDVAAAVSSSLLRASSVTHRELEKNCLRESGERSAALCNGPAPRINTSQSAAGQTVALSLRQVSSSSSSPSSLNNAQTNMQAQQNTAGLPKPCVAQDDFDDWDIDLADLDEVDCQIGQSAKSTAPSPPAATVTPASSASILQPLMSASTPQTLTGGGLREISRHTICSASSSQTIPNGLRTISSHTSSDNQSLQKQAIPSGALRDLSRFSFSGNKAPQGLSSGGASFGTTTLRPTATTPVQCHRPAPPPPSFASAHPQSPGLTTASPSCLKRGPEQLQRQLSTPASSKHNHSLFESISPAPSRPVPPSPFHTPVLTNRLVQLVSASNSKKRPRSESHRPRTRRFPGPAGLLPQQPQGQSLDDIVVSVPSTPAHGAVARSPSQCSSSQTDEDDFSGAAWTAMKTEMGLDERNPLCFLHTYSVVMVLRKAALKQLVKNKVPNMAVLLKSIIPTHTDAKAVFKDPTGEMQGTVHRRLLEDRAGELKAGAVLLLKQVGVFSPSHRNHYLNVTPNNLLRVYSPDGACFSSTQLPPLALEPVLLSSTPSPSVLREPVSKMQLLFDEDDDEEQEREGEAEGSTEPQESVDQSLSTSPQNPTAAAAPQDLGWEADDLDELLGELPEDMYSV